MAGRKDYQERKEARIERLRNASAAAQDEANRRYQNAREIGQHIPFGQPILVGHHSEARARRDAEKININTRKSYESLKKAEYYKDRAGSAERNQSISSDNPEAIELLQEKVDILKAEQKRAKAMNAWYRKHKTVKGFEGLSVQEALAKDKRIENDYSWNKQPYPSDTLTSLNNRIKTAEQRIAQLKVLEQMEEETITGDGWSIEICKDTNRVIIRFEERQSEEMTKKLKSRGFRWTPSIKAWTRLRTQNAINAANMLLHSTRIDGIS